jgi:hypothetical protein
MTSFASMIGSCAMWAGDLAGFGTVERSAVVAALRRMLYLAGLGAGLALAGPLVGIPAIAGLVAMGLSLVVVAGGLLLAADMNQELATLLAMPPPEPARVEKPAALVPPPLPNSTPASQARRPLQVLSRGEIDGRAYAVFMDGSIEIETIFGPRWFASVDLAHEFIGYRKGANLPVSQMAMAS